MNTQRMVEFLQEVRDTCVVDFYFINELRYAVQAEYVAMPTGFIFCDGQDCIITAAGLKQIEFSKWN